MILRLILLPLALLTFALMVAACAAVELIPGGARLRWTVPLDWRPAPVMPGHKEPPP